MAVNGVNGFLHDDIVEKKIQVTERLKKREEERQASLLQRREEKENIIGVNETSQYFADNFAKEKDSIESVLANCNNASDRTMMRERFDIVSQSYQKLQKFVADSAMFLTSYEVRQAQDNLGKLHVQIQEKRDELLPKKKFAFTSRKKTDKHLQPISNGANNIVDKKENLEIELAAYKISGLQGVTQVKGDPDVGNKDVALACLNDCTIKLLGAPSTVHMKNLKNCTVICGPVSSSVFISDCTNCVFVLACQQLRTHTTHDSSIYLHVTSRAIIEDCKNLQFAPYTLSYIGLNEHFDRSGLDVGRNNWNDVDDFNWLATDVHSPNWSIMKEVDRKTFVEE